MTVFIIIMELIVLLLILSMIYSQAQLGREYRDKYQRIAQNEAALEHRIQKLERQIAELKDREVSEE